MREARGQRRPIIVVGRLHAGVGSGHRWRMRRAPWPPRPCPHMSPSRCALDAPNRALQSKFRERLTLAGGRYALGGILPEVEALCQAKVFRNVYYFEIVNGTRRRGAAGRALPGAATGRASTRRRGGRRGMRAEPRERRRSRPRARFARRIDPPARVLRRAARRPLR